MENTERWLRLLECKTPFAPDVQKMEELGGGLFQKLCANSPKGLLSYKGCNSESFGAMHIPTLSTIYKLPTRYAQAGSLPKSETWF